MLIFDTALISDRGGRNYNEDSFGCVQESRKYGCWVVADGLGDADAVSQNCLNVVVEGWGECGDGSHGTILVEAMSLVVIALDRAFVPSVGNRNRRTTEAAHHHAEERPAS